MRSSSTGQCGREGGGHTRYSRHRHVMLPKDIAKLVPKTHLMSESEWRNLGVQQSQGWVHYMIHEPEPHILLFRRPLPKKPKK
ncbi:cyclin-dependent kinases regulatory subunit 1 isoform X1 [Trichosurus vulpecula]|uniref:cyclin-dependent kinases regulatory subunit 1 isoform X1 n=1 Tax=Trichosurus vulpecula TaxID=9337 RepID=UPI00186AC01B|nr:cyclin-dependent kinases regulatory subunit 1 isoform X1 [Trichosurus vulpecula]